MIKNHISGGNIIGLTTCFGLFSAGGLAADSVRSVKRRSGKLVEGGYSLNFKDKIS